MCDINQVLKIKKNYKMCADVQLTRILNNLIFKVVASCKSSIFSFVSQRFPLSNGHLGFIYYSSLLSSKQVSNH